MRKLPPLHEMISTKSIFRIVCIMMGFTCFNRLREFVLFFNTDPGFLFNNFIGIGFGFFAMFGFYRLYQREKELEKPSPIDFASDNSFVNIVKK